MTNSRNRKSGRAFFFTKLLSVLSVSLWPLLLFTGCKGGDDKPLTLQRIIDGMSRGPSGTESVEKAFNTEDPDKAREGILELASHDWGLREPHLKGYATILRGHPHPMVRSAAITALGRAGNAHYTPDVAKALTDDEAMIVRWDAAKALATMQGGGAGPALRSAALNPREDPQVRAEAVASLKNYPSRDTSVTLIRLLGDDSTAVVFRAHEVLVALYGMDLGDQPSQWQGVESRSVAPQVPKYKTYRWYDLSRWGWGKAPEAPAPATTTAPADKNKSIGQD